jgi:Zn finger protein HypA/HybF involved in hydrogenase expression
MSDAYYEGDGQHEAVYICEDCRVVRRISELDHGCPKCGQTMVPLCGDPEWVGDPS